MDATGFYPGDYMGRESLLAGLGGDYSSLLSGANYGLGAQQEDWQKALAPDFTTSPENAQAYVIQALAAGNTAGAQQLMQKFGVTQDQINTQLASTPGRNTGGLYGVLDKTVRPIGEYATEHPAALFAAPFLAAGALGAFGASLGAGGGAVGGEIGAGGSGTFAGGAAAGAANGVADPLLGGGLFGAGGAPSTLAGLSGGGASGFGSAAAGAVNAGTAGLTAGIGSVGGGLAGLGAGSVPAAGSGIAGWGPAVGTIGGGPPVAAASGLGDLGLGGWLTVGSLAAGALQGNKDQTTSTTNAPPAYIAPYLSQAAQAASDQYGQGAYVSPLQQAAVGYGTNVLNGSYLNSNPYLDATFNRAAGAVTNQVQSNFGLAGRNVRGPDAAGTAIYGAAGAGGGYDDLANLIYGGNFQQERNRQQQILPMTNQLGTIGNPQTALDDYIARLRNISGGYGSTTSTTPTQSNLYSGLAGLGLALIPGG